MRSRTALWLGALVAALALAFVAPSPAAADIAPPLLATASAAASAAASVAGDAAPLPAPPATPTVIAAIGIAASLLLSLLERVVPGVRRLLDAIDDRLDRWHAGLGDLFKQGVTFLVGILVAKLVELGGGALTPDAPLEAFAQYLAQLLAAVLFYFVGKPKSVSVAPGAINVRMHGHIDEATFSRVVRGMVTGRSEVHHG